MISTAPTLTNQGQTLLMRAIGGEAITFTRFKAGSGRLATGQDPRTLTDLITPTMTFAIANKDDSQPGLLALSGGFSSLDVQSDFVWRELGVFAKGEDNVEILYAYANEGDNASTVKVLSTDILIVQSVMMLVSVADVSTIAVILDPSRQFAHAGTYTGDGTHKRGINLNFVPSSVILTDEWGQTWDDTDGVVGGMAAGLRGVRSKASTSSADATTWSDQYTALLIGADAENSFAGFWVNYQTGSTASEKISTNKSGTVYHYIAYR